MNTLKFNKEIKITTLSPDNLFGIELQSILYTPIKYRVPVPFIDTANSVNDTEKYILENYSQEEQEKIKYNTTLINEFLSEIFNSDSTSSNDIEEIAKKYMAKQENIDYKPPERLRILDVSDNLDNIDGYLVIDSNVLIDYNCSLLCNFLNLNFDNFNHFFIFFTIYFGMFFESLEKNQLIYLEKNEFLDINSILSFAKEIYIKYKYDIMDTQQLFKNFVDLLYGYNNSSEIDDLTLKQKFYVFCEINKKKLSKISNSYQHTGLFTFKYEIEEPLNLNIDDLAKQINQLDPNGSKINTDYNLCTDNIYTVLYISLYNLVLNNNAIVRQCKNCSKYFSTNKSNNYYCSNIFYQGKTCKDIGNQLYQQRKENNEPVYGKYRNIYAKKATLLKRHPDIYSKDDYENWKKEAKQFLKDIKNNKSTYEEFDTWLNKNK